MNPSLCRPDRFGYIFEKRNDVVIGSLFDFEDLRNREPRLFSNLSSVLFRNLAQLCHCLAGEHFNFQPDFKLALVRPDFAHLRPGITVDHPGNIRATGVSEKRFCLMCGPILAVECAVPSASDLRNPLRTADTTALEASERTSPALPSKRGRAGSVRYPVRVLDRYPKDRRRLPPSLYCCACRN